MNILGIIPSRYASSRFPGKPLVDIKGKSMIRRVYEQALKASSLSDVIVATDDERIYSHVEGFGGKAIFTSEKHQNGTDRCAEVANKLPGFDIVINIQGDEPFIDPQQINLLSSCFTDPEIKIATLVKKVGSNQELLNINSPKVILDNNSNAIYFSRSPIPFCRGIEQSSWLETHTYYKHIGIYGYSVETLSELTTLAISSLERAEALEQLRWIENGYQIKVAITEIETLAIDTPEDLQNILNSL